MKILTHIAILVVAVQICTIALAAERRLSKTADGPSGANKKGEATTLLSGPSSGADLLGMTREDLNRRFPPPQFKHNAACSQFSWHGTDMSTVLDLRYKGNKVAQLRYTTHYGYPRPGTKSNVAIGPWISKSQGKTGAQAVSANDIEAFKIEAFKKQLKQH